MEDTKQLYSAIFSLAGKVDKSLLAAAKDAKSLLKGLDQASGVTDRAMMKAVAGVRKLSAEARASQTAAARFGHAWQEAGHQAHRALEPVHRMLHAIGAITGVTAGIGAVAGAFGGAEALRSSLEEARVRQTLSATLDTVLKSMGRQGDLKGVLADIRQFTDYSPFRYATGVQAYSGLAANLQAAGQFKAYGGLKGVSEILHNVAEVASGGASPDVTLKDVMMHVNAAVGGGRVREGMVTQIGQDIGGSIMPFLTAAIAGDKNASGSVRALSTELQKAAKLGDAGKEKEVQLLEGFLHKRNNFLDSKYLLEAFRKAATDPASPYYHHLEEQADTFTGHLTTFQDKLRDFGTGLGNIEIGVLDPLLVRFNNFFSKERSNRFIDWSEQMEEAARSLDASFAKSGGYQQLKDIGSSIGDIIGINGLGSLTNLSREVTDPINGIRRLKTATGQAFEDSLSGFTDNVTKTLKDVRESVDYIRTNFNDIKAGMFVLAEMWAGKKMLGMAVGLRDILGKTGLMNVEAGVVNVNSATGGANGGIGEALGAGASWLTAIPAVFLALTGISAVELHKRFGILGQGGGEPGLLGTGTSGGAAKADTNPLFKSSRQIAEDARAALEATKKQTTATDEQTKAALALTVASNAAANALALLSRGGFRLGNFPITGSGLSQTEYGPVVPGDQPGGPTFDRDSYNGIGHIQGKAYSLKGAPAGYNAAMHLDYARQHYHIKPGDEYISDKDHKKHRWMDSSGARNPKNEDFYKGTQINFSPTFHIHGGDPHEIVRAVVSHFQDHLPGMLQRAHDQMSASAFA